MARLLVQGHSPVTMGQRCACGTLSCAARACGAWQLRCSVPGGSDAGVGGLLWAAGVTLCNTM
jgi:hypothetical protein